MNNDYKKLWNKIKLNSEYPITGNPEFSLLDPNLADKITEEGQKFLKKICSDCSICQDDKNNMSNCQ